MFFCMHSLLLSGGTIVLLASKKTIHHFNPSDSKLQVIRIMEGQKFGIGYHFSSNKRVFIIQFQSQTKV